MSSYSLRVLIAGAVPALSLTGALAGYRLFMSLAGSMNATANSGTAAEWAQAFAVLLVIVLCSFITLWWTSGYLCFLYRLILFVFKRTSRTPSVPAWAPSILKMLIGSSLSISLITGMQQAHALTDPGSAPHTSQTVEAPSPLFTAPELSQDNEQSASSESATQVPPLKATDPASFNPLFKAPPPDPSQAIITVSSSKHQAISPLFGGLPSPNETLPDEDPPTKSSTDHLYTVVPGDSLWSIAEKHLPEHASGAEVLSLVNEIQRANPTTIPTLETLIFPGQQIILPL